MTEPWSHTWHAESEAGLFAAAAAAVTRHSGASVDERRPVPAPMLDRVVDAFSLSPFERHLLVLAAAAELDPSIIAPAPSCCGGISFAVARERSTGDAHWSAIAAAAPLRRWGLVDVDHRDPLHGRLRVDGRVLLGLLGTRTIDPTIRVLARPLVPVDGLTALPTAARLVDAAVARWSDGADGGPPPLLHLVGPDAGVNGSIVSTAATRLGYAPWRIEASSLPVTAEEIDALAIILEREAVLGDICVVIEDDDPDPSGRRAMKRLLERTSALVAVLSSAPRRDWLRTTAAIAAPRLPEDELEGLWRERLRRAGSPAAVASLAESLAHAFAMRVERITDVAAATAAAAAGGEDLEVAGRRAARTVARGGLEGLAKRVPTGASWDDLVLPEPQSRTLHEIVAHVRQRRTVERAWGFAERRVDGLAVSALFHGPSGVGKTLAARVIASELELDLYRIDLSQVVSKYIGETEKNLRAVFDVAEESGAVLEFDEADALFGKRSEVRDAHDRHANVEVAYLLQRMESYSGVAILTTNLQGNLDGAFLRRIRYAVAFPLPDQAARRALWERVFPASAPTQDLDLDVLAQLSISGASIADIALGAAVLAADAGRPIGMLQILRAAQSEYAKLERGISAVELESWPPLRLDEVRGEDRTAPRSSARRRRSG